jgi:diguanylate cyclase (GGDEF)-like protein
MPHSFREQSIQERRTRRLASRVRAQAAQLAALRSCVRAALDSESTSIVVLDARGVIVDVNAEWRRTARSAGLCEKGFGVGHNYFDVCAAAAHDASTDPADAALARAAARAIEDVLSGARPSAKLGYRCGQQADRRWYEMTVHPYGNDEERGAIIRHRDVTEHAVVRGALLRQNDLIRAVDESLPVIMYERVAADGEWDYRFSSDRFIEVFGMPPDGLWESGGAWASMLHPDDRERVATSYRAAVAEGGGIWRTDFRALTASMRNAWFRAVVNVEVRAGREVRSIGILHDVSDEKSAEERVDYVRDFDEATGLHSRAYFMRELNTALEARSNSGNSFALILLDIDDFHEVNEAFGTPAGDLVLQAFVKRLKDMAPADELPARLAGDKMGVIIEVASMEQAVATAREMVWTLGRDYRIGGQTVSLSVSAGVAMPAGGRSTGGDLLRDASVALDVAFSSGGGKVEAYSAEMGAQNVARLTLKADLREALTTQQFELHYQQKVDLRSGRVVGCEALLRWNHPTRGMRPPGEFLSVAEQSGLIVPLGEWVVREACLQTLRWREAGFDPVPIAVNVSAVQFGRSNVYEMVTRVMAETGAPQGSIDLEVTESAFVDVSDAVALSFRKMRDLGIEIALDDFGTGFSSLAYFRTLPLGVIKVDRSFVQGALENAGDAAIVRCVVGFAREFGLRVIAEGVETAEQLAFVRRVGCHEAQGYYFGRPVPAAEFARVLHRTEAPAQRRIS